MDVRTSLTRPLRPRIDGCCATAFPLGIAVATWDGAATACLWRRSGSVESTRCCHCAGLVRSWASRDDKYGGTSAIAPQCGSGCGPESFSPVYLGKIYACLPELVERRLGHHTIER